MTWHPVKQNTDNPCPCCGKTWMELRAGKVTGSPMSKVMAHYGKPGGRVVYKKIGKKRVKDYTIASPIFGDPAIAIAIEVADVALGGTPSDNNYTNFHMERGHEEEPLAIDAYEAEYFVEVGNGGFYDNGATGCSPDGIVDGNLIEVKSVIKKVHFANIQRKSYDPAYKWQYFHNLKESGAEWIDCISFCRNYHIDGRLFVHRIYAEKSQNEFKMIDSRLNAFFELVEDIKQKMMERIGQ
jgi:hypothetical protein